MEGDAATVRRHAGLVQRMLQLLLITQQQRQRLGLLDSDLDAGPRVGQAVDAHLDVAQFWWIEAHCQLRRAVRRMP